MKKNLTSSPAAGAPAATGAAAAIANGTARPDYVFSDWDVNTIIAGAMREVIAQAVDCIGDTRALCELLEAIANVMIVSPGEYLKAENQRKAPENETARTCREHFPELEDLPESVVFQAADRLITAGAMKYRAAALAIFRAFHLEAVDVLKLAGEAPAVIEHNDVEA